LLSITDAIGGARPILLAVKIGRERDSIWREQKWEWVRTHKAVRAEDPTRERIEAGEMDKESFRYLYVPPEMC